MSGAIHGKSHAALKHFRKAPAALAVYWIYVSRTNRDGIAWPSLAGLARDTGWNKNTCQEAREFLIKHHALERVSGYVRPEWRDLETKERRWRLNLDKSEYYHPTGYIDVNGKRHWMLYFGGETESDIDEPEPFKEEIVDVLPRRTSSETESDIDEPEPFKEEICRCLTAPDVDAAGHRAASDIGPCQIELDSRIELDSKNSEDITQLSGIENRVTGILTRLKLAGIKFHNAHYPKRRELVAAAIEEYSYKTVAIAVQDAKDEGAIWWSYVANRLKEQHPVVLTGEDYITGEYADYIIH